jgi:hypothetical protein
MVRVLLLIAGVAIGLGEFYVWYSEILWHKSEPKRDPRNMRDPY